MNSVNPSAVIISGDLLGLKHLLAKGLSLQARDERGSTLLLAAAFHGHLAIVEFLIQQGVNVNEGNQVNYTPLMTAGREKRVEVVEALLRAKADPEIIAQGMKAVHWALMNTIPKGPPWETEARLIEILKTFKRFGANLNTKGERGNTPLMDAAWWGLPSVTEFLLKDGAKTNEKDNEGKMAEDYAKMRLAKNFSAEINASYQKVIQLLTTKSKDL